MAIVSIDRLLDSVCDELTVPRLKVSKKRGSRRTSSPFEFSRTRNVPASHLRASPAVRPDVFLPAPSVARSRVPRDPPDQRPALLPSYMKNLFPAVKHHQTALNIYHKGVPALPGSRCKKCRGTDVECIKIKFPAGNDAKKCALCALSGCKCAYEASDL